MDKCPEHRLQQTFVKSLLRTRYSEGYWDYMYTSVYVYLVCICRGGTGVICTHLYTYILYVYAGASQVTLEVKNLPADAGDTRDPSWIPGSGRSSGEGCGNSLQDSCLENPMDRGAW